MKMYTCVCIFYTHTHTHTLTYESFCCTPWANKVKVAQSCPTLRDPMDFIVHGILQARNTGLGSLSLLQGIFPSQRLNPGLLHCRQILYQLSHKGSPRIPEWVAYPFSSGSSQPRNRTRVLCIAGGFFTNWVIREACCKSTTFQ